MRADLFLFSRGLAKSRTHAAELIKNGVELSGKKIGKPSQDIPENTPENEIKILEPSKYVADTGYLWELLVRFQPDGLYEQCHLRLLRKGAHLLPKLVWL